MWSDSHKAFKIEISLSCTNQNEYSFTLIGTFLNILIFLSNKKLIIGDSRHSVVSGIES